MQGGPHERRRNHRPSGRGGCQLDQDLHGDRVAVIGIPEDIETPTRILYAGTYLVAMPPEYDPDILTGEDIIHDYLVYIVRDHRPVDA